MTTGHFIPHMKGWKMVWKMVWKGALASLAAAALLMSSTTMANAQYPIPVQSDIDSVLSGDWQGSVIAQNGQRYQIIMHISSIMDGACTVTYDLVGEKNYYQRMTSVSCEHDRLLFTNDSTSASYQGRLVPNGRVLEGIWEQARTRVPLRLYKIQPIFHPQEPTPSASAYLERPVEVVNRPAGIKLSGTLTAPNDVDKHPAVILISDQGAQDRDAADPTGHRPFLVLSHRFAELGIATLRMDDRGVGESTGSADADIEDLTTDVFSAIDRIAGEPFIDPARIYLYGHGVGGLVAAEVAKKDPGRVAGIVLAATPAIDGKLWMLARAKAADELHFIDPPITQAALQMISSWYDIVLAAHERGGREATTADDVVNRICTVTDSLMEINADLLAVYPAAVQMRRAGRETFVKKVIIPWINGYINADAPARLGNIDVPVLCLIAERDVNVPASINEPAWQGLFEVIPKLEMSVFPDVNHGFQTCEACTEEESRNTAETMDPAVIMTVARFVKN